MSENKSEKFLQFVKKISRKFLPRFSAHYVVYTILFCAVIFSVVQIVTATTPNPGHPWTEVGDGLIQFTAPTSLRTYTGPDANATLLTTNALVTVAQGGIGVGTLASNGVLYGNGTGAVQALAVNAGATQCLTQASSAAPAWGSCGSSTWDTIGDAAGNGAIAMGATVQTMDWATLDTQAGLTLNANALTTGEALTVAHTTSVIADGGSLLRLSSTSADTGGATAGTLLDLSGNGTTSGTLSRVASSTLTTGKLMDLQVSGTAAAASQTALNILTTGANATAGVTTYGAQIANTHSTNTSTNVGLYVTASGGATANYAAIFAAGNVGIGTTTPAVTLDLGTSGTTVRTSVYRGNFFNDVNNSITIFQATTTQMLLGSTTGLTASSPFVSFVGDTNTGIYRPTADNLGFATAGAARLFIDSGGLVGVGTDAPDRLLHSELSDSGTNTVVYPLRLSHVTSGTATTAFGVGQEFEVENASGTNRTVSTLDFPFTDATDATEDTDFALKLIDAGTLSERLRITSDGVTQFSSNAVPATTDTAALGTASLMWSDLFLASGSVINWNSDVTLTHSSNALTVDGGSLVFNEAGEDFDVRVEGDTNANLLFVDASTDRVGLHTDAPTHTLTLGSTGNGVALYNTSDQTTNYERGFMRWSSNILEIGNEKAGSGTARVLNITTSSGILRLNDGNSTATFTGGVLTIGSRGITGLRYLSLDTAYSTTAWGTAGAGFKGGAITYTDTNSSGTVAFNAVHSLLQPTLAASSATTYTDAVTLYIANAPTAGTNATLTNPWGLYQAAGNTYFGGTVSFNANAVPAASDGAALGTSSLMWSDLFLASGAVANFNNGDVTLTHSADTLTVAGGSLVLPNAGLTIGSSVPFSDSAGTLTLQNVDAIDATTETTLEGAIDIAGDISGTGLSAVTIGADKVLESHLKAVDAAVDEECLTYESTTGDFEWQTCGGGSGASTALDNLASVAINTSLISDTDVTDDLGSMAIRWNDIFAETIGTGDTAADTFSLRARDVDGAAWTDFLTLTANNTPTATMSGITASANFTPTASDGAALGTSSLMWSDLFLASGSVVNWNNGNVTLTHSAGALTLAGGTLALGANNLTMTGSLAATGARVTKGWFTDIESTNMPTVGGTSLSSTFAPIASPTFTGTVTVPATNFTVGASLPFSDSAGTLTFQNVDAIDATTESTIEAALDTLANLTSVQGQAISLAAPFTLAADPDADRILFWDDSAGGTAYLTASTGLTITGTSLTADLGTAITSSEITNDEIVDADINSAAAIAYSKLSLTNSLLEADLKAVDSASDEECLTYETTTGDFEWQTCGAGSSAISGLTLATGTNTIDNTDYTQEWQWSTLSATGLKLSSSSTAAASNAQKVLEVTTTGTNGTAQTTYGGYFTNTHNGTGAVNVAAYFSASGATNNYAAIFENGNVGIGTTAPAASALGVQSNGSAITAIIIGNNSATANRYSEIAFQTDTSPTGFSGKSAIKGYSISGGTNLGSKLGLQTQTTGGSIADRILINEVGNVGVGDTSPDQLLEVLSSGAANTQLSIGNTNAGTFDPQIGFELADGTNTFTMGVDDSDSDKFKISTTALGTSDRFTIDSSGNTGIGTTTPATKLHVYKNAGGDYNSQITMEEGLADGYAQISFIGTGREWHFGVGGGSETAFSVQNKFYIWDQQAAAMRFKIDTAGQVELPSLTLTDTGSQFDVNITLGNDAGADTVSGINVDMTSVDTGADGDVLQGVTIANLSGGNANVTESALYIGSGWDNAINANGTGVSLTELARLDGTSAALVDLDDLISGDGAGGTSTGSGLESGTGGIGLLQGCAANEILKWNDGASTWGCAADSTSAGTADLDVPYDSDVDKTMTIDSTTGLIFDMTTSGDFIIKDNGTAFATFSNTGTITFANLTNCNVLGTNSSGVVDCRAGVSTESAIDSTPLADLPNGVGNIAEVMNSAEPTITPQTTASRIWVNGSIYLGGDSTDDETSTFRVYRDTADDTSCDGTQVGVDMVGFMTESASETLMFPFSLIDSPATSSAVYYSVCGYTSTATTPNSVDLVMITIQEIPATGADLAELYATRDESLEAGDVVSLDETLAVGVKKSEKVYDGDIIGIVSTAPALVIGGIKDPNVKAVPIALSGRVPVKVITENGPIKAGDLLTSSSVPGVAMRATKAGQIIGQAMTDFSGEGVGSVMVFVKTDYGNGARLVDLLPESTTEVDEVGKALLSQFISQKEQLMQSVDLSEITTDRLMAGLEVITPTLTTDTVNTNTISPSTGDAISLVLGDNGKFIIGKSEVVANEDGTKSITTKSAITFDSLGNATFAGTVTAKEIKIDDMEEIQQIADQINELSEGQQAFTLTADAMNKLSNALKLTQADILKLQKDVADTGMALAAMTSTVNGLTTAGADVENRLKTIEDLLAVNAFDSLTSVTAATLKVSGGTTFEGQAEFNGLTFFSQTAAFTGGVSFSGPTEFTVPPLFNKDTAGYALVKQGGKRVHVAFDQPYVATPVVHTSMTFEKDDGIDDTEADKIFAQDIRFVVVDKDPTGFTILLNKTPSRDIRFSWTALSIKDPKIFESVLEGLVIDPEETPDPIPELPSDPAPAVEVPPPAETPAPEPEILPSDADPVDVPVTESADEPPAEALPADPVGTPAPPSNTVEV